MRPIFSQVCLWQGCTTTRSSYLNQHWSIPQSQPGRYTAVNYIAKLAASTHHSIRLILPTDAHWIIPVDGFETQRNEVSNE